MNDLPTIDDLIANDGTYADPERQHALFSYLRKHEPVRWTVPQRFRPFWCITQHADVLEAERHPEIFINAPRTKLIDTELEQQIAESGGQSNHGQIIRSLMQMDGAEHTAYRKMAQPPFQSKCVAELEPLVRKMAREAVDVLVCSGECDFYNDVAVWFPLRVIMAILGLPESDAGRLMDMTHAFFAGSDRERGPNNLIKATNDLVEYFVPLINERRKCPGRDVVSSVVHATINGQPLGNLEMVSFLVSLAVAGHETVSATIAGGVLALIENPQECWKLKDNQCSIATAVEEMVRWVSPAKHFFRTAVRDHVIGGKSIRRGDHLMLCYPSANRDEDVFEMPFQFRAGRTPNRHLGFGSGPHTCLGTSLARAELRIFFSELLSRTDSLELAGAPAWVETSFAGGLKRLPVRVNIS